MEEKSSSFTPEQSLELIGKFILNYRKNLKGNSFYFLLWGWLIALASISHFMILSYLLRQEAFDKIGLFSAVNWIIFPFVGLIITIVRARKPSVKKESRSHIDNFITTLWQFTALAIIITLFLCLKINHVFVTPFILTIVALSTMVTGFTINFRPLIFGGIIFFLFAVISSFFNDEYQLLINALAIALGYLVPGYMLRASKTE
ncbi:MAG TPA: hypothetical protein VI583_06220 [Cyclobacteriaceae bacterium]|nr:hypothetical protein [Cyclobacteriaceae bacterium]